MRICYIANAGSLHTYRWLRYFAENGHQVYLVSLISNNPNIDFESASIKENFSDTSSKIKKLRAEYEKIGVKMYPLDITHPFKIPIVLLKTRRYIRRLKPEIVHAHYVSTNGFLGTFSGFHPIVITAWGSDVLIDAKGLKKQLVKYALKKADLVTCDGEKSKDAMLNLGINQKKIKLIYHGMDTKVFTSEQRSKEFIKNLFDNEDFHVVISNRSLKPIYNIETVIKTIPLILKKMSDAKFIIAGEGSEEYYLRDLAKSLGISDSIRFVGWIPHEELPKYLASSDVYVSTSLSDSFAVSTLEAMACELAPVVTAVGDNRNWIKDGENGFVVPIKNPEALAEKIIYLLENEGVRKKFGKINREIVKEKADYNKEMEKMENIYIELIEKYKK